jgi:hypothetical protein
MSLCPTIESRHWSRQATIACLGSSCVTITPPLSTSPPTVSGVHRALPTRGFQFRANHAPTSRQRGNERRDARATVSGTAAVHGRCATLPGWVEHDRSTLQHGSQMPALRSPGHPDFGRRQSSGVRVRASAGVLPVPGGTRLARPVSGDRGWRQGAPARMALGPRLGLRVAAPGMAVGRVAVVHGAVALQTVEVVSAAHLPDGAAARAHHQ